MMIKITNACHMGCKHCIDNAQPNGQYMTMDTFYKAISFQRSFAGPFLIITGGEPTEHPYFKDMVMHLASRWIYYPSKMPLCTTIATNGVWMQENYHFVTSTCGSNITWQVTTVPGLYPTQIDTSLTVFKLPNVIVCDDIGPMYPMGRAKTNNLPWKAKASRCFNIRAVAKQLADANKLGDCAIQSILMPLVAKMQWCTPQIAPNGAIKLGESDLCPICSWIDKPEYEIFEDILNFECHHCDFINSKLPLQYKLLLKGGTKEVP